MTVITTMGNACMTGDMQKMQAGNGSGGAWPANNRAIYVPFVVTQPVTAFQMAFEVTTQSGNYDIGLYDQYGARLVSLTSTAVPAAGIAKANIADTALNPGTYFMALLLSTTAAAVWRTNIGTTGSWTVAGVVDSDEGSTALPATATFTTIGAAYVPVIAVATVATI